MKVFDVVFDGYYHICVLAESPEDALHNASALYIGPCDEVSITEVKE